MKSSDQVLKNRIDEPLLFGSLKELGLNIMLEIVVLPFFEEQRAPVLRILTDRGTEFCGKAESHPFELYLAKQRLDLRKQTVSVKDFTRRSCQSFTKFHFAKDFTFRLMSCKKILTNGFAIIITRERTKARRAVAELRW